LANKSESAAQHEKVVVETSGDTRSTQSISICQKMALYFQEDAPFPISSYPWGCGI
jgi:hypothetical protein